MRFTRAIKEAVPRGPPGVIEALWAVVLADGDRDDEEDALMRMVAPTARRRRPTARSPHRLEPARQPERLMSPRCRCTTRPDNRAAHDALWALASATPCATAALPPPTRSIATMAYDASWARPDLVLGQICNLPYRARFRDRVTLIGAA